ALQLTNQYLRALPGIVEGFNGFYAKRGVYVLMNQNRILILLGVGAIILLVAIILLLRALWRRLRPRAVAKRIAGAVLTSPQMPSLTLRDRASSSATPRASPVVVRPDPSPIRRKTLPVLPARRIRTCRRPSH